MHELSIMQSILSQLESIAAEHHLKRIKKVVIQIGDFRQCVPEFLQFAFETLTQQTVAEGAQLIIESIPIQTECETCHHVFTISKQTFTCTHCNGTQLKLLSGKELILASVEGEQ